MFAARAFQLAAHSLHNLKVASSPRRSALTYPHALVIRQNDTTKADTTSRWSSPSALTHPHALVIRQNVPTKADTISHWSSPSALKYPHALVIRQNVTTKSRHQVIRVHPAHSPAAHDSIRSACLLWRYAAFGEYRRRLKFKSTTQRRWRRSSFPIPACSD